MKISLSIKISIMILVLGSAFIFCDRLYAGTEIAWPDSDYSTGWQQTGCIDEYDCVDTASSCSGDASDYIRSYGTTGRISRYSFTPFTASSNYDSIKIEFCDKLVGDFPDFSDKYKAKIYWGSDDSTCSERTPGTSWGTWSFVLDERISTGDALTASNLDTLQIEVKVTTAGFETYEWINYIKITGYYTTAVPPDVPYDLQVENADDPDTVTDNTPEFRLKFSSTNDGDSTSMTYIQVIEVSLNGQNTDTLWNDSISHDPAEPKDIFIELGSYSGTALETHHFYYWRAKSKGKYGIGDWSSFDSSWFQLGWTTYAEPALTNDTLQNDTLDNDECIHLDVECLKERWPDENGDSCWAVMTSSGASELVYVFKSEGGMGWDSPWGGTNSPLVVGTDGIGNSDADLCFNFGLDTLFALSRDRFDNDSFMVNINYSVDGTTWVKDTLIEKYMAADSDYMSPALLQDSINSNYRVYYVQNELDPQRVSYKHTLAPLESLSVESVRCTLIFYNTDCGGNYCRDTVEAGDYIWHINVNQHRIQGKLWYIMVALMRPHGTSYLNKLYLGRSEDGINFYFPTGEPFMSLGADGSWDELSDYRSAVIFEDTNYFTLYYTGVDELYGNPATNWKMGHTTLWYPYLQAEPTTRYRRRRGD